MADAALAQVSSSRTTPQKTRRAPDHIELIHPMRFTEQKLTLLGE